MRKLKTDRESQCDAVTCGCYGHGTPNAPAGDRCPARAHWTHWGRNLCFAHGLALQHKTVPVEMYEDRREEERCASH